MSGGMQVPVPTPDDVNSWGEVIGGFMAGVFGLRGLQVIRARRDDTSLEDLIRAVKEDGEATRGVLRRIESGMSDMNSGIAVLLDRRHPE